MNRFFKWLALLASVASTQVCAQIGDSFSPLIGWRQASGLEVTPIHIGLLPNGTLFFINEYNFNEHPEVNIAAPGFLPEFLFLMKPTPIASQPPDSVLIQPLAGPPPFVSLLDSVTNAVEFQSLVCTGHALMADGKVFFAGGADAHVDLNLYGKGDLNGSLTVDGIAESLTLDPSASAWTVPW